MANAPASLCFRFDSELKSWNWKESSSAEKPMAWTPAFAATPLPLRVMLSDAVTHESVNLEPDKTFVASNVVKWTGKSLGIDWAVLMEPMENGDVRLTGQLQAAVERCVSVGVGCEVDLNGWTWHDDFRFQREIQSIEAVCERCRLPVRRARRTFDLSLRRDQFGQRFADRGDRHRRAAHLPGGRRRARFIFRRLLRFRAHLADVEFPGPRRVQLRVEIVERSRGWRIPSSACRIFMIAIRTTSSAPFRMVGVWLPFTDPGTISNIGDFGFAFYGRRRDGAFAGAGRGILTFGYTEPWLYWLPMPRE